MCSSRGLCGGNSRPNRSSSSEGSSSGAHYALCALGVGLIALGIVMIVWTVIPMDGEAPSDAPTTPGNYTTLSDNNDDDDETLTESTKSSTVAMVLVGVGAVLLFLSICLGVRSKRRSGNRSSQPGATGVLLMDHVAGQQEEPWVVTFQYYSNLKYLEMYGKQSDCFPGLKLLICTSPITYKILK